MFQTNKQPDRRRVLAYIAAAAMAVVVIMVAVVVVVIVRRPELPMGAQLPGVDEPTRLPGPVRPRPPFQDAGCPDVQVLAVPGTWESSPTDDPLNPSQFPIALLRNVTEPLVQEFDHARVQVYTVAYTAQFHNPLSTDEQVSYNDSRSEGEQAAVDAITKMADACPLTSYVLVGFSQGAVIAGDIASDIGNGRGPVDEDLVLGVTLIADGRRQEGVGHSIGPTPAGEGAEVVLSEVPMLSALGLTMTGGRPGGFGALQDRTNEICAPGDLICAAPQQAFSITKLPQTLDVLAGGMGRPVHAMYNTAQFWNIDGHTATEWTLNWARDLIDNAPYPAHG